MKVLLIDDSLTVAHYVRATLGSAYIVRHALGFPEVSGEIVRHMPDVILLDLHLPAMPGAAVAGSVRSLGCWAPIVLLTGASAREALDAQKSIGAFGVVWKGSADAVLRDTMAKAAKQAVRPPRVPLSLHLS